MLCSIHDARVGRPVKLSSVNPQWINRQATSQTTYDLTNREIERNVDTLLWCSEAQHCSARFAANTKPQFLDHSRRWEGTAHLFLQQITRTLPSALILYISSPSLKNMSAAEMHSREKPLHLRSPLRSTLYFQSAPPR